MSADHSAEGLFVHCEVVEPFAENARLVGCRRSGAAVLVDPGGHVGQLLEVAAAEQLTVGAIWLTHAHLDHVTGVSDAIASLGPVPILLHRLGELRAEVLHLPGHSPGHVGFWLAPQRTILSGDVLFAGSIGRTDLPGGDYDTLMSSIREGMLTLGDDVSVLCGHGPDTTIGRERTSNPFLAA